MKESVHSVDRDQILWQNFKNGDQQALTKIYQEYYAHMLTYGLKIKPNHEFIKDCIHEVFYDIMSHIKNIGDTDNILFYLITSLRHKIFRKLRYDISFKYDDNYYLQNLDLSDGFSEESVIHQENTRLKKNMIKVLIDKLPPRQKEALLMKFYLYFEYKDIASLMNLNLQSVRNLVHRAIKSLREQVQKDYSTQL